MKGIGPQHLKDSYWQDVEDQLKSVFYDIVFAPLVAILRKGNQEVALENAGGSELAKALRSGQIQYANGVFSGHFSVELSKALRAIGAVFYPQRKIYHLDPAKVPEWVKAEAGVAQMRARSMHEALVRQLDEVTAGLDKAIERRPIDAEGAIRRIDKGFQHAAEQLKIAPRLGSEAVDRLRREYNANMQLYIKEWSQKAIKDLRQDVEANALAGYRFDHLTEDIRHRYGVTANKARFLARQETGLFMAKYRKERFGEAGVRRYRWSTAHDERVRDSHKHLDGRIFSYDDPPITDRATGERNNPGEDFNCRCVDVPVLESAALEA